MVLYLAFVDSAVTEFENVANLRVDPSNYDSFSVLARLRCHVESVPGGKGTANLVGKCKFCQSGYSAAFSQEHFGYHQVEEQVSHKRVPSRALFGLECRGLEPEGFVTEGSESGTTMEVAFEHGNEWTGYDEKAKIAVGIMEFKIVFVRC